MYGFYLRWMYLENKLIQPGGITLAGVPIDLRQVNLPNSSWLSATTISRRGNRPMPASTPMAAR